MIVVGKHETGEDVYGKPLLPPSDLTNVNNFDSAMGNRLQIVEMPCFPC